MNIKTILIVLSTSALTGCTFEEFVSSGTTEQVVDAAVVAAGAFGGPIAAGAVGLIGGVLAGFERYFSNKKKRSKIEQAQDAFHGIVEGIQIAKKHIPAEHLDKLHEKLEEHIPEWVQPLIEKSKIEKRN